MEDEHETRATIISIDVGKKVDWTAIVTMEVVQIRKPIIIPYQVNIDYGKTRRTDHIYYYIRNIERLPLGTDYIKQAERAYSLYHQVKKKTGMNPHLLVDATGVGEPIFDLFTRYKLQPIGITITGGDSVHKISSKRLTVPKRDLATEVEKGLQERKLQIADSISLKHVLIDELSNFQVKVNPETGYEQFGHRQGAHDDIVLAIAMGCWYGGRYLLKKCLRSADKRLLFRNNK